MVEQLVYYVRRKLKDAETRYLRAEKACLALIYVAQRLRHYLLAHMVQLLTKSHPIHSFLRRLVLFGRLAQWFLQLSKFKIIAITPTAIRGQVIADLLSNFPGEDGWDIIDDIHRELPTVALMEAAGAIWTLHFDGSSIGNFTKIPTCEKQNK